MVRMKAGWKLVCNLYFSQIYIGPFFERKGRHEFFFIFFLSLYGSDGRI